MWTGLAVWFVLTIILYRALFAGIPRGSVPKSRPRRAGEVAMRIGISVGFPFLGLWLIAIMFAERLVRRAAS